MLQFDEYKVKLNNLKPELEELGQALDLEAAERELDMLQAESASDGFWDNVEKARKIQQRISQLEGKINAQAKRLSTWDDLMVMCEMGNEEEDESLVPEVEEGFEGLLRNMEEARLATLLSGEYDPSPAIVSLQAGAGGTEAQDWAQMLYRMYTRWTERHNFTYKILDYEEGDEAGIKSAAIAIEGENAYGYLKSENGVHRLVRVSPFDANARRQTSFASVEVMPDLPEDVEIEIRPEDIEMQVYRASGAGGMDVIKLKDFLKELGGIDRELLAQAVIIGNQQLKDGNDIYLKDIYQRIAEENNLSAKDAEHRIGSALELMGYRGNLPKVEETFGRRMGRIRVTPKQFVKVMAMKFG